MGTAGSFCKSKLGSAKSTPETINETHLDKNESAYTARRNLAEEFLKNSEALIQEITTNSKWQHHETRYLLSQFRKLGKSKDATNLTQQQFIEFLPILLKSIFISSSYKEFEQNKLYSKWSKHFIKLFSTENNDQITFQSFANTLSTACRGDNNEKAEC